MTPNRLDGMEQLVKNLSAEGQTSRADCVAELIAEVRRLSSIRREVGWFRIIKTKGDGIEHLDGHIVEKKFETDPHVVTTTNYHWIPVYAGREDGLPFD